MYWGFISLVTFNQCFDENMLMISPYNPFHFGDGSRVDHTKGQVGAGCRDQSPVCRGQLWANQKPANLAQVGLRGWGAYVGIRRGSDAAIRGSREVARSGGIRKKVERNWGEAESTRRIGREDTKVRRRLEEKNGRRIEAIRRGEKRDWKPLEREDQTPREGWRRKETTIRPNWCRTGIECWHSIAKWNVQWRTDLLPTDGNSSKSSDTRKPRVTWWVYNKAH